MRSILSILLLTIAAFSLAGCFLFESADADIVAFVLDGVIDGTLTIDAATHTLSVAVEPMDVAAAVPVVTVSEGATLTGQPPLADGEAVTYVVTAENGDAVPWTVTVRVREGMAFTLDGDRVVLMHGYTSSDPSENEALGDGVPFLSAGASQATVYAGAEAFDYTVPASPDVDNVSLYLDYNGSLQVGLFDETMLRWTYYVASSGTSYIINGDMLVGVVSLNLVHLGAEGETAIGDFEGTAVDDVDIADHAVTQGFFKMRRLADGLFGG